MLLLPHLQQFHPIEPTHVELLSEKLKPKSFKKGEFITVAGAVQRNLYFVQSGVQMSYFEAERKDHVVAFTYPPGWCAVPELFFFQSPSRYDIVCLTDSEMDYLTFDELQLLFDQSQPLERLFRKMTEAMLAGSINRHIELHTLTMEERFKSFCRRSPHLLPCAHKYLASYLGIDATNFSKLFNNVKF